MIVHDSSCMHGFGGSSKPLDGQPTWIVVRAIMKNLIRRNPSVQNSMPQLGLTNQLPQMTRDVVCVLYFGKGPYVLDKD